MDWSILHTLNDFLYHHDAVEDPLLFYVNISEALFIAVLVGLLLFANGPRLRPWRRTAVAAGLSAGLALAVGKVISELVDRARPFVADPTFDDGRITSTYESGSYVGVALLALLVVGMVLLRRQWQTWAIAAGRTYVIPDDVIAMTRAHLQAIVTRYPGVGPVPRLLCGDADLDDPIGAGLGVYRDCARPIATHLERFLPEWTGQ